jgi:hypothetical protein
MKMIIEKCLRGLAILLLLPVVLVVLPGLAAFNTAENMKMKRKSKDENFISRP